MPLSIETMPKSRRGRSAKYDYSEWLTLDENGYGEPFIVVAGNDYECSTVSKQVFFSRYAHENGVNVITAKLSDATVTDTEGNEITIDEGVAVQFVSTEVKPYANRGSKHED